ncbi:hypothetical protein [Microbacterium saperdae]|uniref:Uncharacterized protein n=1 Tax=Microbacterium saperdae TaxID=69368 RepID=A0A543BN38_9MICO|nr:hypothetical protein [Microbacterium saperdae]TQL86213.1 hypothetical protein FB560_1862 [Microbacterium saperdae]GGM49729.1 hypothetical protein GCM10010489_21460 [Microbacterium saperdae]
MANPFEKRATEYLRDDEAFLSVVSPEPLTTFFHQPAREDRLLDRLVMIIGTPGSGKTTMTRLFQYATIRTLLQNESLDTYRPLIATLAQCGAVRDGVPTVLGARIPLESEYREFWEFPYPDDLKLGLMTALIQARAVLAWISNLQTTGVPLEAIRIIPRENAGAAAASIGGTDTADVLAKATEIELAIYRISAALVPPSVDSISKTASTAYRPFDVIDTVEVTHDSETLVLRPLIILDDAHSLQADQFELLRRWLARRELKVARWVITRFDALTPRQVLLSPGLSSEREITYIKMQNDKGRKRERDAFRKMAKDMSNRYLRRMDSFNRRRLTELSSLLATVPEPLSASKVERLRKHADTVQRRTNVTPARRAELESKVDGYLSSRASEELRLACLEIVMERYLKRTKAHASQLDLFGADSDDFDPEPSKPIAVDAGVVDGAEIHLLHEFDRPYYFGIDTLCDASSENAEQFLQLAGVLVNHLETKLIRGRELTLTSREQNKLLRERATELVREWDFPHARAVRGLVEEIATQCVLKSMEPNASLKGGAIAFGILQEEFEQIPTTHPQLAKILQFAVAYNAITLVQDHGTKKQKWCLIELGGTLLLKHGLTLNRGGFLERTVGDLAAIVSGTTHVK